MSTRISLGFKLSLWWVLLAAYSAHAYSTERNPVVAEATGATIGNGRVSLNMKFWNCTDKSITLDHRVLPWGQMATGLIVYKGAGIGKELDTMSLVDDLPPRDVTIRPGEFVAGTLNLEETFPALRKAKHFDDLVVFWVYDAKVTGIPSAGKFGGMVSLSSASSDRERSSEACR